MRENLLLPIRLYYRWNTSIPGYISWMNTHARPYTTYSSHLPMGYSHTWLRIWMSRGTCAITRPSTTCSTHLPMDYSHTSLSTWMSRGTCVNPTIFYLSVSSADGIYPILGWEPRRVEVLGKEHGKCFSVISPSQEGIRYFLLQVFRESIQSLPWEEAWWEHL